MAIKTIIDTNVLVASLSSKSKHHWLIEFLIYQRIELFVNEDILLEYEEVLKWKYSESAAANFLAALKELPNVFYARVYYRWNLIRDPDDNKFVDCYVTAGADYLITHDKHFAVLASIPFPKVNVVRLDEFQVALNIHQ
ncbi:MAG TPA: putative toxin-antitoxin system toxin component, PIN family [Puia sp.]|nr:putative toxin-antitoxin system toxin component, PIN family [Puia sp.]